MALIEKAASLVVEPLLSTRTTKVYGKEVAVEIMTLFYDLDKFAVGFEPQWKRHLLAGGKIYRNRLSTMCLGEVMTILVLLHASDYRTFKHFYPDYVCRHLQVEFPHLLSYSRFVERIPMAFAALTAFVQTVIDPLKDISQIEHIRHRSVINYFADIIAGLIAYTYRKKLGSLNLRHEQYRFLKGLSV